VSARSVRARHNRRLGTGGRDAEVIRTSDLLLTITGVALLGDFCLLLAADTLGEIAGT
jgi:hypothetical protein